MEAEEAVRSLDSEACRPCMLEGMGLFAGFVEGVV